MQIAKNKGILTKMNVCWPHVLWLKEYKMIFMRIFFVFDVIFLNKT